MISIADPRTDGAGTGTNMRKVGLLAWAALLTLLCIGTGRPEDRGGPNDKPPIAQATPRGRIDAATLDYYQAVVKQLEAHKAFPVEAREKKLNGTAVVVFEIDRDGSLVSKRLQQSSGYDILDREALATIDRSQPFPAPPQGLGRMFLTFSLPIKFNVW